MQNKDSVLLFEHIVFENALLSGAVAVISKIAEHLLC
jgi:hypothetical protein